MAISLAERRRWWWQKGMEVDRAMDLEQFGATKFRSCAIPPQAYRGGSPSGRFRLLGSPPTSAGGEPAELRLGIITRCLRKQPLGLGTVGLWSQ